MAAIENAEVILSSALDAEQDCYDNIPENLQESERCEKMEEAIDNLESAIEKLSEAKDYISDASA